jgi:peptide/nickel transport system permease protein
MTTSEIVSRREIVREFRHSKSGLAGVGILLALVVTTIYSVAAIPLESYRQWNSPSFWIDLPKAAAPAWTNLGLGTKVPEHIVLHSEDASISRSFQGGVVSEVHSYTVNFDYDSYPSDFMLLYSARYSGVKPLLRIDVVRPDGLEFEIHFASISPQQGDRPSISRVFSTSSTIVDKMKDNLDKFSYRQDPTRPQVMIFSDANEKRVLKGQYVIRETFLLYGSNDDVVDSGVILGGKVYGLMGTDELRRDLAVGILWGAPVALFIGLTVSISAVLIGLIYGIFAGYKGSRTDEGLMRINDIFYSLPVLPLLVILSVTVGRSIFLITGFLVIFGWVGMAKISRSIALQLKNMPYVEAAKLMGQSDTKIIFKHIIPQLLPLTFASVAISVPVAILGEAALSFLGLGDPSIPTWGQILHDANTAGAASRGLWWWIVPPGIMIALTGLAFVLIGNALDAIVNPRSRRR